VALSFFYSAGVVIHGRKIGSWSDMNIQPSVPEADVVTTVAKTIIIFVLHIVAN
jgi:hypothetical protein